MARQWTANQQAWQTCLEQDGKVRIAATFTSMLWRVGVAVALVAFFIYTRYISGDIGQRGLTIAIVGFAALIIGCIVFVVKFYGGKSIEVDRHGITMMDGTTHQWADIARVGVYSPMKSPPMVSLNLTEPAWNAYMSTQSAAAKAMHTGNKMVMRERSVVIPTYLDATPDELAPWLDQFARGTDTAQ